MQEQQNGLTPQILAELASSPAGQQLIRALQQQGGQQLQQAIGKAAEGDYAQAKHILSALSNSPDIQQLLQQLGG